MRYDMRETKHSLDNLDHDNRIILLIWAKRTIDAREEIGWFEHTTDWDSYLTIELNNGEAFDTASTCFEIVNFNDKLISNESAIVQEIEVEIWETDEAEEIITKRVKIDDIKSIEWNR